MLPSTIRLGAKITNRHDDDIAINCRQPAGSRNIVASINSFIHLFIQVTLRTTCKAVSIIRDSHKQMLSRICFAVMVSHT